MCRASSTLYTKRQLDMLFRSWECTEPLPAKDNKVLVCWPHQGWEIDLAECELTGLKSDYGERLYRVTLSSKLGRALDETIQESHVIDYRRRLAELRRQENLDRNRFLTELMHAAQGDEHQAAVTYRERTGSDWTTAYQAVVNAPIESKAQEEVMMDERKPKFGPGTTFQTRGKHPLTCVVTDVLTTRNLAGDVVGIRYVATHEFAGQTVTDRDVLETTIAMGLPNKPEEADDDLQAPTHSRPRTPSC